MTFAFFQTLALIALTWGSPLWGREPAPHTPKYSKSGKRIVEDQLVSAHSSEVLRESKTAYLFLGAGLVAAEGSVGVFLQPNLSMFLRGVVQQDMLARGKTKLYLVGVEWFPENSFYLSTGLGLRDGFEVNYLNSLGRQKSIHRSIDRGVHVAVGNRWQWKHLTLGGEWFSLYLPLLQSKTATMDLQFRLATFQVGIAF